MTRNENFTFTLPETNTEISLSFDKVQELVNVMNEMNKKGITEDECRKIMLEECFWFRKNKECRSLSKLRNNQSGDTNQGVSTDESEPLFKIVDSKKNGRYPVCVPTDHVITIYPKNLVQESLKSSERKKPAREGSSLLLFITFVLAAGISFAMFLKKKGIYQLN